MGKATQVIDGAECSVETGYGNVVKIEHAEGKRNAHVKIRAEHLRQPVKAWADMEDHRTVGPLLHARDTGARVAYRIVVKRKREIDPGLPWDKVPTFDRVRDLVSIDAAGGAGSNGSGSAPQPPETPSAPAPAPNGASGASAPSQGASGPACPDCGEPMAPGTIARAIDGTQVHRECARKRAMANPDQQVSAPTGGRRIEEGKPWEAVNSDGSPNVGSYSVQAAVGMVGMAHKLLVDHRVRSGEVGPPSPAQLNALAHVLLGAADRAQAGVRSDGRVDRMAQSHARARAMVWTALEAYPVPWGASDEDRKAWANTLADYCAEMLRVAVGLAS